MKRDKKKMITVITAVFAVVTVICAVYIAVSGLGLVEGYDFGLGAYYYADIPGFEKIIDDGAYKASVPLWVHIVIFLVWGAVVWKLWTWIDRKR